MRNRVLLYGRQFGMLSVIGINHLRGWLCRCDCGAICTQEASALTRGKAVSCGCRRRAVLKASNLQHGQTYSRAHNIWKELFRRCYDPKRRAYPNYGGRGIVVADRWRDFSAFLADMGPCPDGLTIDRLDNNKGYEPGNCRWASRADQNRNKRNNIIVEWRGARMTLTEAARMEGQPVGRVRDRVQFLGWDLARALTQPKWGAHA